MVQVFKSIFLFSGMHFQDYCRQFEYSCGSAEKWEILNFLDTWNAILLTMLSVFINF